jgi:tRNA G46 methylase TrmB
VPTSWRGERAPNHGVGWHEHHHDLFAGTERFFRPGYAANLMSSWIPALEGIQAKLEAGARVADVGCGHGVSTVLMAEVYPRSEFVGFDYHEASIEHAHLGRVGRTGRQRAVRGRLGQAVSGEGV